MACTTLLRDRATGSTLDERHDHVLVDTSPGIAIMTWTGRKLVRLLAGEETRQTTFPDTGDDDTGDDEAKDAHGAALFTRRGDYLATGWLASYQHIQ